MGVRHCVWRRSATVLLKSCIWFRNQSSKLRNASLHINSGPVEGKWLATQWKDWFQFLIKERPLDYFLKLRVAGQITQLKQMGSNATETKHESPKPLTPGLGFRSSRGLRLCLPACLPASRLWHRKFQSHPSGAPCKGQNFTLTPHRCQGDQRERVGRGENSLEADKLRKGREGRDGDTNQRCRASSQEKGCWDTANWTVSTKCPGLSSHSSAVDSSVGCYLQFFWASVHVYKGPRYGYNDTNVIGLKNK